MRLALVAATVLTAVTAHAVKADVLDDLAEKANVDPDALRGAMASQPDVDVEEYLIFDGKLTAPAPLFAIDWRVACIESKESGGANVANRTGSGASGVLQYMPGTFRAHATEMGHSDWSPWTPWQARAVAAHDLALGRRSQWTVAGC